MIKENIKNIRKAKGLSQEELAIKLNVVRQTVSKWEQGLSVPDAEMLIVLSEVLETSVGTLLGESIVKKQTDDLKVIAEKLEIINLQLARSREMKRKKLTILLSLMVVMIIVFFIMLGIVDSPYLGWDYSDPERAVVGVALHAFEWFFVRLSPILLLGSIVGIFLIWKNEK